jgi:hypothetical protein
MPKKQRTFIGSNYGLASQNPSRKNQKEPGGTNARLGYSQIFLEIGSYFGALVLGAVVGGVASLAGAVSSLLHPVSIMPIARPSSTIRVYKLFIDTRKLYQNPKADKQIFWWGNCSPGTKPTRMPLGHMRVVTHKERL